MEEIVIPVKTKEGKIERVIIKPEVLPSKPTPPAVVPKPVEPLPSSLPSRGEGKIVNTPTVSRDEVLEPLIAPLIAEAKVAVAPDLQVRLKDALMRRFKDLYDNAELLEFLTKSVTSGGMGMLMADARRVVSLVGSRIGKITDEMQRIELGKTKLALEKEAEMKLVRATIRAERDVREQNMTYEYVTGKPAGSTKAAPTPPPSSYQPPAPRLGKPKVQDVVPAVPKLIGPVEEIKTMTLADFRKLGADPNAACQKIRDKIALIAAESYERRALALEAWRGAEPMRQYALMLNARLASAPLSAPPLTDAEFNAIMELNRILRF